jgi:hypothetical protein
LDAARVPGSSGHGGPSGYATKIVSVEEEPVTGPEDQAFDHASRTSQVFQLGSSTSIGDYVALGENQQFLFHTHVRVIDIYLLDMVSGHEFLVNRIAGELNAIRWHWQIDCLPHLISIQALHRKLAK